MLRILLLIPTAILIAISIGEANSDAGRGTTKDIVYSTDSQTLDREIESTVSPEPCVWNPGDPNMMHYPQLPEEGGWDVIATQPVILAEDFRSAGTGWITDFHFWGGWRLGSEGMVIQFDFALWTDIPADPPQTPYSRPGDLLWEKSMPIADVNVVQVNPPTLKGWYNPTTGEVIRDDHQTYYQYNVCLDSADWYPLDEDVIYWLSVSAEVADPRSTQWGWSNTGDHWWDDAVWAYVGQLNWIDMWEPHKQQSVGLSLVITGIEEFECGDVDGSNAVDIDDVVYLINFIFAGGPPPDPYESGDTNCSGGVDIDDVVWLINYIFAGGNTPCDIDNDGNSDC